MHEHREIRVLIVILNFDMVHICTLLHFENVDVFLRGGVELYFEATVSILLTALISINGRNLIRKLSFFNLRVSFPCYVG